MKGKRGGTRGLLSCFQKTFSGFVYEPVLAVRTYSMSVSINPYEIF